MLIATAKWYSYRSSRARVHKIEVIEVISYNKKI
jgi:hypothetical protein